MKKELKQRWIEELRNTTAPASARYLRIADGRMSAIGVLYEMQGGRWMGPDPAAPKDPGYKYYYVPRPEDSEYPMSFAMVPEFFRKSVGLRKDVLQRLYRRQLKGCSHNAIADWLEGLKDV